MLQKRQINNAVFDRIGHGRAEITTLVHDYAAGHVIELHFHEADQLVYASREVMTVRTKDGIWVVPTDRAVWIPARIPHTITMSGTVAMRTLYLRRRLAKTLPRNCCVVNVSALLRELILRACAFSELAKKVSQQRHLIEIILDQLNAIQMVPLQLPNVTDARASRIARILHDDPSDSRPLSELCRGGGASQRTVERLFQQDAGDDVWKMAATVAVDAGDAASSGRSEGDACGFGSGIQHAERVYFDVSKNIGNDARFLL